MSEVQAVDVLVVQQLDALLARPVREQGGKPDDRLRAETPVVQQLAERPSDHQGMITMGWLISRTSREGFEAVHAEIRRLECDHNPAALAI